MEKIFFSILFLGLFNVSFGQFIDDFSDNNLNADPAWQGDLNNYVINTDEQLQLNATESGSSQLYVATNFPDSIEWNIYTKLEFSPSGSNMLRIDLMTDNVDANIASGYYLEVGESGSSDAFQLYRQDQGNSTLLGSAAMGSFGGSSNEARIKVIRSSDGFWSVAMDYSGATNFQNEIEIFDDQLVLSSGFFALTCSYTSSRVDKFFFDDVSVTSIIQDELAPSLVSFEIIDDRNILLCFDEELDQVSAENIFNYSIDKGIGNPEQAIYDDSNFCVLLKLNPALNAGNTYTLSINNILDLVGNAYMGQEDFFLVEDPLLGDLIVNEILSDPFSGGFDFVEIYNNSDKTLSLDKVGIQNFSRSNDFVQLPKGIMMEGRSYLAITEGRILTLGLYEAPADANVIESNLPAFNISDGNVSIVVDGVVMDSFDYEESFHFELLDLTKGVSLERISFDDETNNSINWTSASAATNFATPGYANGNSRSFTAPLEEVIQIDNPIFSPNGDAADDQLIMRYGLEEHGWVLNARVFDLQGREVRNLFQNKILGLDGFLTWDGINSEGDIASIGAYVIWFELFDLEGRVQYFKKPVVLADFLD